MNAGCAPQWIGETHLPDESTDVLRYGGASGSTPGLPGPEEAEAFARPPHDGVGLHDDERVPPSWPQLGQADPEDTIGRSEMRASRPRMLENGELLTKSEDLKLESSPAPERHDHLQKSFQGFLEIAFFPMEILIDQDVVFPDAHNVVNADGSHHDIDLLEK